MRHFKWKCSLKRYVISVRLIHKSCLCQICPQGTVEKPAELNVVILTHSAFQGNRLNSGSAGRSHLVPPGLRRRVWDCDIYPIPTLPHSSLSFSQSKNKSVCLMCNCEEVKSVVCERHAPQTEPLWFRTHPIVDTVPQSQHMMQDWFDWSDFTWKSSGLLLIITVLGKV